MFDILELNTKNEKVRESYATMKDEVGVEDPSFLFVVKGIIPVDIPDYLDVEARLIKNINITLGERHNYSFRRVRVVNFIMSSVPRFQRFVVLEEEEGNIDDAVLVVNIEGMDVNKYLTRVEFLGKKTKYLKRYEYYLFALSFALFETLILNFR